MLSDRSWRLKAAGLRAQGLSQTEIAKRCGVTPGAVSKALNPERAKEYTRRANERRDPERKRQQDASYEQRMMHPCAGCGRPVSRCAERCRPCFIEHVQEDRRRIVEMWAAGASMREIAAAIGTSKVSLGTTMAEMRRDGWDLPYRYRIANGRRVAESVPLGKEES